LLLLLFLVVQRRHTHKQALHSHTERHTHECRRTNTDKGQRFRWKAPAAGDASFVLCSQVFPIEGRANLLTYRLAGTLDSDWKRGVCEPRATAVKCTLF